MKKIFLILILSFTSIVSCQEETKEEKMIKQFVTDLFDDEIESKKVVDNYLEIKLDNKNRLSIAERKKMAIGIIEKARNGESEELGWLVPNYKIKNIKNSKVYPYQDYEDLSPFEISGIESHKENIYVLLDSKKENILQYFFLNENKDKIISFSLFIKSDVAWFFGY